MARCPFTPPPCACNGKQVKVATGRDFRIWTHAEERSAAARPSMVVPNRAISVINVTIFVIDVDGDKRALIAACTVRMTIR